MSPICSLVADLKPSCCYLIRSCVSSLLLPLTLEPSWVTFWNEAFPISRCPHTHRAQSPRRQPVLRKRQGVPDGGSEGCTSTRAVLASWRDCNKRPQTGGASNNRILFTQMLEAKSPKLRCWQGSAPSRGSGGGSFLPFQLRGPRRPWACGCIAPVSASVRLHVAICPVCLSSPFRDTRLWIGPSLLHYDLILTNYPCKDPISK